MACFEAANSAYRQCMGGDYMKKSIAERELLYSLKGDASKKKLVVKTSEPYLCKLSRYRAKVEQILRNVAKGQLP